jgi:hypothetical protein
MLLLGLFGGWWDMPPTGRSLFLRGRLAGYAAIAAVIAYVVHPGAVTYGLIRRRLRSASVRLDSRTRGIRIHS